MKIVVQWGRLDRNQHGPKIAPGVWATRRDAISIVPLGRDFYLRDQGRRLIGRRLWIYGPSGACVSFDVILLFKKCPYRRGTKYGPQDGPATVIL